MILKDMKIRFLIYIGILLLPVIFMFSCEHKSDISEIPELCFENDILPIFQTSCGLSGCHDEATAKKGLVYSDYNTIMKSISPGNPNGSKAYKAIVSLFNEPMPPNNRLSEEARTLIRIWIEQGAKNTSCADTSNIIK